MSKLVTTAGMNPFFIGSQSYVVTSSKQNIDLTKQKYLSKLQKQIDDQRQRNKEPLQEVLENREFNEKAIVPYQYHEQKSNFQEFKQKGTVAKKN